MDNEYSKTKLITALVLNLAIFSLELVGLVLSIEKHGLKVFQFYTENSNYFALVVSAMFSVGCILALKKGEKIAVWLNVLRFIATVCLTITLVVVLTLIVPMYPGLFVEMMFKNSCLYQHLICPLLSIVSFIFFENQEKLPKKAILISLIPTVIYGTTCIFLNLIRVMVGPYPFFYFYVIPWQVSVFSLVAIVAGAVLISFVLYLAYNRGKSRKTHILANPVFEQNR